MKADEDENVRDRRSGSRTNVMNSEVNDEGDDAEAEAKSQKTARSYGEDENIEDGDPTSIRQRRNIVKETVSHVVNPVIDCVDINHILDSVDFDRHLERIRLQDVVEKIDWNKLLLEHIDIERVVERSNVQAIVAQSSK